MAARTPIPARTTATTSTSTTELSASAPITTTTASDKPSFLRRLAAFKPLRLLNILRRPALRPLVLVEKHASVPTDPAPYNPLAAIDARTPPSESPCAPMPEAKPKGELEPVEPLPACFMPLIMVSTSTSFHSLSSLDDVSVVLKKPIVATEPVATHLLMVPTRTPALISSARRRRPRPATISTPRKTMLAARKLLRPGLYDDEVVCPASPRAAQEPFSIVVRAEHVIGKPSLSPECIVTGLSTPEPELAPWWTRPADAPITTCARPPAPTTPPPTSTSTLTWAMTPMSAAAPGTGARRCLLADLCCRPSGRPRSLLAPLACTHEAPARPALNAHHLPVFLL